MTANSKQISPPPSKRSSITKNTKRRASSVIVPGLRRKSQTTISTSTALAYAKKYPGIYSNSLFVDRNLPADATPDNISVSITTMLEREKDRTNPERQDLATIVAGVIESELLGSFTGIEEDCKSSKSAKYHLHVIVALASDGSAKARWWAGELAFGHIKLAAIYTLSSACGSNVFKAGRLARTDSMLWGIGDIPLPGTPNAQEVLIDRMSPRLARSVATKVTSPVKQKKGILDNSKYDALLNTKTLLKSV
jgi:hypothetical protein